MKPNNLFSVSVVVTEKNNLPCIELRKVTTETELIKKIISCAFHGQPVVVLPQFTDKLKSIRSLSDKGIIYYDKKSGEYKYTI